MEGYRRTLVPRNSKFEKPHGSRDEFEATIQLSDCIESYHVQLQGLYASHCRPLSCAIVPIRYDVLGPENAVDLVKRGLGEIAKMDYVSRTSLLNWVFSSRGRWRRSAFVPTDQEWFDPIFR